MSIEQTEIAEKQGGDKQKRMEDERMVVIKTSYFFEKNALKEDLEGRLFQQKS
jgi:hypothetical protein